MYCFKEELIVRKQISSFIVVFLFFIFSLTGAAEVANRSDASPLPDRRMKPEPHPYTEPAGTLQFEVIPRISIDEEGSHRVRRFTLPALLKIALTDTTAFHLGAETFEWTRIKNRKEDLDRTTRRMGDVYIAAKLNLFESHAHPQLQDMALKPYVSLPREKYDLAYGGPKGGLSIPMVWEEYNGFQFFFTPTLSAARNSYRDGYVAEFEQETKAYYDLGRGWDGFLGFHCSMKAETGRSWKPTAKAGIGRKLETDTALELGVDIGLNSSVDDVALALSVIHRY